ncbi:MAG: hypothetical protein KC621_21305 [Myxococcales bacterium]|nr:hypothetical protein [Myxococcales bacterium]
MMTTWILTSMLSTAHAEPPEGWFLAGSDAKAYEADVVEEAHTGTGSARFRSKQGEKPRGFGTMMQQMQPADYTGNRLRMTAWVKTDDVADWAGMWLRVDGAPIRC